MGAWLLRLGADMNLPIFCRTLTHTFLSCFHLDDKSSFSFSSLPAVYVNNRPIIHLLSAGFTRSPLEDTIFRYYTMRDYNCPPAITSVPPEALSQPLIGL